MFEFLQLTRMCMYSFIRSFAHLFDHSKCVLYDDVYACASCVCTFVPPHVYNNYRRLYSLIGPCPGFLLPCFLLCISNYEGEFLGTDDSNCLVRLNFELKSEYLASATIPPLHPSQSAFHSTSLWSVNTILYLFFTRNFLARND